MFCFKRGLKITCALAVLVFCHLSGVSPAGAQVSDDITNEECLRCHISDIPTLITAADSFVPYSEDNLVADEMVCYGCHDGTVLDSRMNAWTDQRHRTGMAPSLDVTIPPNFPLDKKNLVYCGTCHSPHAIEGTSYLRGYQENSQMCIQCHRGKGEGPEKGSHPVMVAVKKVSEKVLAGGARYGKNEKGERVIICQTCHVVHGAPPGEKILLKPVSGKGVKESQLCQECHGDNPSRPKHGTGDQTHTVNQKPDKTKMPKVWVNGEKVILSSEGKLICRTCHVSHRAANKTKLLITGNDRGLFCTQCHPEKDKEGSKLENQGTHSIGVTLKPEMKPSKIIKLEDGRVTCNTCHIAHNAFDSARRILLIASNKNSALCGNCHNQETTMGLIEARQAGTHPVNIIPDEKRELPRILKENGAILGDRGQMVCGSCHRLHGGKVGSSNLILENDRSQLCGSCHRELNTLTIEQAERNHTHPVNVFSTKVKIPAEILAAGGVLGPGGEIVCDTCHRPHRALGGTSNLVMDDRESLICLKCHTDAAPVLNSEHNMIEIAPEEKNIRGETVTQSRGGICSACHLTHYGREGKNWAKEVDGQGDLITQLCNSCHAKGECGEKKLVGKFTHPLQINIKNADGKTTLPLFYENGVEIPEDVLIMQTTQGESMDGLVTCATCHDVHQWDPSDPKKGTTKNTEGDRSNSFLRIADSESRLCINCHSDKNLFLENTEHDLTVTAPKEKNVRDETIKEGGLCGACHLTHNGEGPLMWARKIGELQDDPFRQLCIKTCHEKGGNAEKKPLPEGTHPTGVPITKAEGKTSFPLYNKKGRVLRPTSVDASVNLKEYFVSCGSCHDAHRWDPQSNEQGRRANTEGDGTNSFLRKVFAGEDPLCLDCHGKFRSLIASEHDLRITAPKEKNILEKTAEQTGPCGACHLPHKSKGPKNWARKLDLEYDPNNQFCVDTCHIEGECGTKKQTGNITHPVDIPIFDIRVTTTLPLYNEKGKKDIFGNVVCATCHNVHQWDPAVADKGPGKNLEGTAKDSFLRIKDDEKSTLCANCHIENKFIANTDHDLSITAPKEKNILGQTVKESGLCGSCHLTHNGMAVLLWAKIPGEEGNNMLTILCTSCHQKDRVSEKKLIGAYTHSVGVRVLDKGLITNLPLFDPSGKRKMDGEVTCATCHNPHRWDPLEEQSDHEKNEEGDGSNSFLRVDNLDSLLCINCHQREQLVVNSDHDLAITGPNLKNIMEETVFDSGVCSPCHVPHRGNNVFGWALPLNKEAGDDPITQMCGSCHRKGGVAESKQRADVKSALSGPGNHPVNQKISDWMVSSLPKFDENGMEVKEKGKMACMTCHFVHQWSPMQFEKASRSPQMFSGTNFERIRIGAISYYSDDAVYIDVDEGKKIKEQENFAVLKEDELIAYLKVEKLNPFAKEGFEAFASILSEEEDALIEIGDAVIDHNKLAKGIEGDGSNSFLRKENTGGSTLCFDCHEDKKTIINTDHDLRITAPDEWNRKGLTVKESGVCSVCHTAHNGNERIMGAKPLVIRNWLKGDSGYLEGGFSPLCNSCHNRLGASFKKVAENVEGNKTGHHLMLPLSPKDTAIRLPRVYMPLYTVEGEKIDPTRKESVPGDNIYVSCSTCHNPHQWSIDNPYQRNVFSEEKGAYINTEGDANTSFLRVKNSAGKTCEQCHLQQKGTWQWETGKGGGGGRGVDVNVSRENLFTAGIDAPPEAEQPTEEEISQKLKELMDRDRDVEIAAQKQRELDEKRKKAELLQSLSPELRELLNIDQKEDNTEKETLDTLQSKLPLVMKYEYPKPVRLGDNFRLTLVFSEAINPRTIPQVSFISTGLVTPKIPYINTDPKAGERDQRYMFTTTTMSNDTFITSPINLTREMGGEITIVVEGAEGILGNRMEKEASETFYLDTNPDILRFYDTARLNAGKKVIYGDKLPLELFASGADEMMISEHPLFVGAKWEPYREKITQKVTKKLGNRTIYARFRREFESGFGKRELLSDVVSAEFEIARLQKEGEFQTLIDMDTVLVKEKSPYLFIGEVKIARGTTVTIGPGVQVLFETRFYKKEKRSEKGKLLVEGKLIAIGEKEQPIVFSPRKLPATPGDWEGIYFIRNVPGEKSRIENSKIEMARYGIYCSYSSPAIVNNNLVNNQMSGISCNDSAAPLISGNKITRNLVGISSHLSDPEIFQNEISNNLTKGILLKGNSKPLIEANRITENRVGIECQEISSPKIIGNAIIKNKVGIKCLSYSPPGISHNKISANEIGIVVDEAVPMVVLNDIDNNNIGLDLKNAFHNFLIGNNNIYSNKQYNIKLENYFMDVNAPENWWGSYDMDEIEQSIYDFADLEEEKYQKKGWRNAETIESSRQEGWEQLLMDESYDETAENEDEYDYDEEEEQLGRVLFYPFLVSERK